MMLLPPLTYISEPGGDVWPSPGDVRIQLRCMNKDDQKKSIGFSTIFFIHALDSPAARRSASPFRVSDLHVQAPHLSACPRAITCVHHLCPQPPGTPLTHSHVFLT
ncbi:hypothetical protein E2C01_037144 [Portunus trituberculatus]|uniref:Uncharacterized protein n=1 Tax=Portunus trituberculatus TaxID=210409 RepID=A0A5B7FDC5_PORTR|nr:hypothetical protein [Portunus trituberculatus]